MRAVCVKGGDIRENVGAQIGRAEADDAAIIIQQAHQVDGLVAGGNAEGLGCLIKGRCKAAFDSIVTRGYCPSLSCRIAFAQKCGDY